MRACAWCKGPIPDGARRDAITCSKRCRQARHRFLSTVGTAPAVTDRPLRLAYADPPYPGRSRKYYGGHPDYAGEVDHAELVQQLEAFDGWALSTSADALQDVLALCPPGVRVAAWVRGERFHSTARGPLNAWEPVIFSGGRARPVAPAGERDGSVAEVLGDTSRAATRDTSRGSVATVRTDVLTLTSRPRMADPHRVIGSKPAGFCRWLFELLGATAGDELVDMFPGSGGVARAWDAYVIRT